MKKVDVLKAQLVIITGLLVFSWIFKSSDVSQILVYISLGFGLVVLIIPSFGELLVKGWFKLAEALGWINSRVLLSVIFFFLLYPISLLFRLSTKNPLQLKKSNEESVFETRNHKYTKEDLENIW